MAVSFRFRFGPVRSPRRSDSGAPEILGKFFNKFVDQPLGVCNPITSLCVGVIHARKTVASVELLKELLNGKVLEPSRFSDSRPPRGVAVVPLMRRKNGTGYRQMVQR